MKSAIFQSTLKEILTKLQRSALTKKQQKHFYGQFLRYGQQVVQDTDQGPMLRQVKLYTSRYSQAEWYNTAKYSLIGTTHSHSLFKCLVSHMLPRPYTHTHKTSFELQGDFLTVSPLWIQNKALNPLKQRSRLSCWPPQVIQSRRLKTIVLSPRDYRLEDEQRWRDK